MSKQIHITALAPYKIYPAKMGGQKGIALFYKYLSGLLPVTVISTRNNDQPLDLQATFLPILSNSRLRYINPFLFFTFKKIIRQKQSTHFILEHPYFGWLGILLKKKLGIKLVVHSHNIESLRFKSNGKWWWRLLWRYEKYVHHKADINFFITDEDRLYAIANYKTDPAKCYTVTYGIEMKQLPNIDESAKMKKKLREIYSINEETKILLFNGTLDYKPNLDGLDVILDHINPYLKKESNFKYKIIICGKNLPLVYDNLKKYLGENIIYAGFVDDISVYFNGADIFINPVTDGGGIKTKLVEALGSGLSCISTISGAIGIPASIVQDKLIVLPDGDWVNFTKAIIAIDTKENTAATFFNYFYWGNIAKKAATIING